MISRKRTGSAAETILTAAAGAIGMIDRNECTLDDYLDRHAPADFRRTVEHLLLCFYRYRGFFAGELNRLVSRPPENKVRNLLFAVFTQVRFQSAIAPESAASVAVDAAKRQRNTVPINSSMPFCAVLSQKELPFPLTPAIFCRLRFIPAGKSGILNRNFKRLPDCLSPNLPFLSGWKKELQKLIFPAVC